MKTPNNLPDVEDLLKSFEYNKETGVLYRIMSDGTRKKTGTPCNGYLVLGYKYTTYYAHRLIWKINTGADPLGEIDHINGVKSDNRMQNLRDVSVGTNRKNMPLRSDNTSGHQGVYYHKPAKKWCAEIHFSSGKEYLGLFEKKQDAIEARKKAEYTHSFHNNHGRI